jgi:GNAT superfamily N-acetyltransferase
MNNTPDRRRAVMRPAAPGDVQAIAALAGELGYPASTLEMGPRLSALLSRADHAVFVAELTGSIIGWIHVCVVESLESPPFAEIRGMVVTEAERGRGIGKDLVAVAEQWAIEKSCSKIRVRSNSMRTDTRQFYEKLAYVVKKNQNVFDKQFR